MRLCVRETAWGGGGGNGRMLLDTCPHGIATDANLYLQPQLSLRENTNPPEVLNCSENKEKKKRKKEKPPTLWGTELLCKEKL